MGDRLPWQQSVRFDGRTGSGCHRESALGRETIIHAPADRVTGMEKISVPFNFAYVSDSCYDAGINIDPCKTRSVTVYVNSTAVYWNNGTNGLPLNGVAEASYDFSRITGPTIIKASASCGGTARTTEKVVYEDPEVTDCASRIGKPVSVADGSVFVAESDFSVLGIVPIQFSRYHNSRQSVMRALGRCGAIRSIPGS